MKRRAVRCSAMIVLAALFAIGLGCAKSPNDSQLARQIQSKLSEDSGLHGKPITVQISGGVVTLSGMVENETQRTAASRYAAATPGIKEVVNNLEVVNDLQTASTPPLPAVDQTAQKQTPAPQNPAASPVPQKSRPSTAHRQAPPDSTLTAEAPPSAADNTPPVVENPAPSQAAPPPPAPGPASAPKKVTVPAGTPVPIRLLDSIDSESAQTGQTFHATLDSSLPTDTYDDVPSGYDVQGHVEEVKSAGKFSGQSLLVLKLDSITIGSTSYNLEVDPYRRQGANRTTDTAKKVGAGAVLGAIIGGIAGGGKGAGIGAAAGGGVGGGVQAASKGPPIRLRPETVLNFTLKSSLTVMLDKGPDAGRQKLDTPAPQ